jgi:hypothetical protein
VSDHCRRPDCLIVVRYIIHRIPRALSHGLEFPRLGSTVGEDGVACAIWRKTGRSWPKTWREGFFCRAAVQGWKMRLSWRSTSKIEGDPAENRRKTRELVAYFVRAGCVELASRLAGQAPGRSGCPAWVVKDVGEILKELEEGGALKIRITEIHPPAPARPTFRKVPESVIDAPADLRSEATADGNGQECSSKAECPGAASVSCAQKPPPAPLEPIEPRVWVPTRSPGGGMRLVPLRRN